MKVRSYEEFPVQGRRVFVRVDFNVPLKDGVIQDDTRIRAALPTLQALLSKGARLVVASHLGRPKKGPDPSLSLRPVAARLSELLGKPVAFSNSPSGPEAEAMTQVLQPGEAMMLENLRFNPGEEKNDPIYAQALAQLADFYVDDAFGTAHRPAASIVGITKHLPSAAGALLLREIHVLDALTSAPKKPLIMLAGGAKISDKIAVIDRLADKLDVLLVGGAMAFAFLKAKGFGIGKSLLDEAGVETARQLLAGGLDIRLPLDFVVAEDVKPGAPRQVVAWDAIPETAKGLDIGPATVAAFQAEIAKAGTVLWNGPMGLFEVPPFDEGTKALAHAMADGGAMSIVGGGETGEIVMDLGLAPKLGHVSTGGGAFLSYLSGEILPGVEALSY